MDIKAIGVMSTGDMGQAVAAQLRQRGYEVLTALGARSERTRALAQAAGITDVGTLDELVGRVDVLLSIMNPGAALDFARECARLIGLLKRKPVFVDCNAVAPGTVLAMEKALQAAGGVLVDAGIIGPPPRGEARARLYLSGPRARALEGLGTPQFSVHIVSERVGDASAVKMCYSAMNKGLQALFTELMVAAHRLGVTDALRGEFSGRINDVYRYAMAELPKMPSKAYRWAPEMLEVAATFEEVGLTPRMLQGAADMCEFVAASPLGKETPETRDPGRTGEDVVRLLAQR